MSAFGAWSSQYAVDMQNNRHVATAITGVCVLL